MHKVFITRQIPDKGIKLLRDKGYEVDISEKDGVLTREELLLALRSKSYDAVLSLLTDKIDDQIMASAPSVKIFANYAVGYDNFDLEAAKARGVIMTNTPGVLTNAVAELALALMLAVARRIPESDQYVRTGKFVGWGPMLLLGTELAGKKLGIVGSGRIGFTVARQAKNGFQMSVCYHDLRQNEAMEKELEAEFKASLDDLLRESDFVSIHVPLLPTTRHLIDQAKLSLMKPSAILINTSRGPVIDESALVEALKTGIIRGAGLDVFESEPQLASGLTELSNAVLAPHIGSATDFTRDEMSRLAAQNIIAVLEGQSPPNLI